MSISSFHAGATAGKCLIQSEFNARVWKNFMSRLPSREDIINLLVVLEELCQFHSDESKPLVIDYGVVKQLAKDLRVHEMLRDEFLTPAVFMRLDKDDGGEQVPITSLMSVITRTITQQGLFASLGCFSVGHPTSECIMSIDALEDWLYKLSHRLIQIQKMTEQFLPLWVFTAAHTIAFFHGKQHPSKFQLPVPGSARVNTVTISVKIRDLVSSETMQSLLQLTKMYLDDIDANPFSRLRAVRYYDSFTVFDSGRGSADSSGGAPTEQCPIFAAGYMTPVFMERLLAVYGQTDYRRFLTFAIAWDNRKTVPGVRYFWPVMDANNKGYIDRSDVEKLVTSMVALLQCLPAACGPQGPDAISILVDETMDLFTSHLKSSTSCRSNPEALLTLAEALESPTAFGTVVGYLGNTQAFIEYECREDTAHKLFVAKQVNEAKATRLKLSQTTRTGQLAALQGIIDDCFFANTSSLGPKNRFECFAEFLDYHESLYGGESMEPWLAKYYQWEQQEAENHQLLLLESQYMLSEGDSSSLMGLRDEDLSSDGIQLRE